jgi:hypothetical protein
MLNPEVLRRLQNRPQPRLGMRYGPDVWALKKGLLFLERSSRVVPCTVKNAGITPKMPSLVAAVEGIRKCYETDPVMGTDPEFFLKKDGQLVPAFDFLPDKHSTQNGLFWDGFQAETVVPLSGSHARDVCHAILAQRIGTQLQKLHAMDLQVAPQAVWRIPPRMLELASEAHVSLSCDHSRNAYATYSRCVMEPRKLGWRFAGGHVHFTLAQEEREPDNIRYLVKTLDALVGVPSVCLAQNYDHFIRRRYYGLAGEYRLPSHGLEWRTLSNFWLVHPRAFMLVFDMCRHALNAGRARLRNIFVGGERQIRDTINYCDVKSARDFMRLNREFYTALMRSLYGTERPFWAAIEGGIDKVIPNWGLDVVRDWRLPDDWRHVPAWRDLT